MATRAARRPAKAPPEPEVIWRGSEALRPFLRPVGELNRHPSNPRRGDVAAIAASFERFGQQQAISTYDAGDVTVAGNHRILAIEQLGWTHIAVIPAEFDSDAEALAYLLADNGTHDRGAYDVAQLLEQLKIVQAQAQAAEGVELGGLGLEGTGYTTGHIAQFTRDLERARLAATPPAEFPPLDPNALHVDYKCPSCGHGWSGNPRPGET